MKKPWYVYIVLCSRGALYTGIALNVTKRIAQHNAGTGARSVKALGLPVKLVYTEQMPNKSAALKREYQIKQLSPVAKRHTIELYSKKPKKGPYQ